jgi:Na+-transporting methylmalonyl-CoA/oxaloacetate decarboxylase gamma subunit
MSQEPFNVFMLLAPLLLGGLIAAINANQVNDATESAEAKVRGWQSRTSVQTGFFSKYVLNPPLWLIVKFCDWTDGFAHRGAKNGTRVAATMYLVGLWLLILYAAVIVVITLVILIVVIYIVAKILSSSGTSEVTYSRPQEGRTEDEKVLEHVGIRGKKVYAGTNWFNEELKGRVDDEGNLYRGTSWFNEEKIGRIDDEGNIYKGTIRMKEEKVGRVDRDGTLYKGSNWFTEEKTGRIDEDGTVHKGTNWFNEEKQGRIGY